MNIQNFLIDLFLIFICMLCVWIAPWRYHFSKKKVKLRLFWFLFQENLWKNFKTKEISLKVFVFQLVGYIVNLFVMILIIVCYINEINLNYYVPKIYVLGNFIVCGIFSVS